MKHMIPLLVCSFIVVNLVSGYVNADRSLASPAAVRLDLKKQVEHGQSLQATSQATRPLIREERGE